MIRPFNFLMGRLFSVNKGERRSMDIDDALSIKLREKLLQFFPTGIVAFDVETTGLSPLVDKIVELSAIKLKKDMTHQCFDHRVNPGIEIPVLTTRIHGLTNAMVEKAPRIKEVLPEFLDFVGGLPLVGHNVKFDFGHLITNLHLEGLPCPGFQIYCSLKAARKAFENMPNNKLATLADKLGIPLKNHHCALDDAAASMIVFARAVDEKEGMAKHSFFSNAESFKTEAFDIPRRLLPLAEKATHQEVVDIVYRGGIHGARPIRPISFFPLPEGAVLYGRCLLSGEYKNFFLRKIVDFKELSSDEIKERVEAMEKKKH